MNSMLEFRKNLKELLINQSKLQADLSISDEGIQEIIDSLNSGELIVSVVGEVNRGKSTFLNALLANNVFPSRATVCTAGVTILDDGEKPEADIIYNNGSVDHIDFGDMEPSKKLEQIISRKNENVKDINALKIRYPNPFTGNGILLVDTPGVNDPESWREEVTYNYLSASDAVIMLLDPMQPLSASEVEFLQEKILGRSISKLIFVVNKMDYIPQVDRSGILDRVRDGISKFVPNPKIFPISAKIALEMKLSKSTVDDQSSGFSKFENYLLSFLIKGRGGALLETKIQKALSELSTMSNNVENRIGALNMERNEVVKELGTAKKKLTTLISNKKELNKKILKEDKVIEQKLIQVVENRRNHFNNSIVERLLKESSVTSLRKKINIFQKETLESVEEELKNINHYLNEKFGSESSNLIEGVQDVLHQLNRHSSDLLSTIEVNSEIIKVRSEQSNFDPDVKSGATVGGAVGGVVGAAAASQAVFATSAGLMAFTGLGTLLVGALTGGIGLLAGAGIASMMKKNKEQKNPQAFIETKTVVNNEDAISSVEAFLESLQIRSKDLSSTIVHTFNQNVMNPIERQIDNQQSLISNINSDVGKTDTDQKSLREFLSDKTISINEFNNSYSNLLQSINN